MKGVKFLLKAKKCNKILKNISHFLGKDKASFYLCPPKLTSGVGERGKGTREELF